MLPSPHKSFNGEFNELQSVSGFSVDLVAAIRSFLHQTRQRIYSHSMQTRVWIQNNGNIIRTVGFSTAIARVSTYERIRKILMNWQQSTKQSRQLMRCFSMNTPTTVICAWSHSYIGTFAICGRHSFVVNIKSYIPHTRITENPIKSTCTIKQTSES